VILVIWSGQRGSRLGACTIKDDFSLLSFPSSRRHPSLNHLRSQGTETKPEDVARLSPLADKHFNVVGRYHFTVTDSILRGELRPLRVPEAPEELFWAVGA
jgi:hypothetical protein